MKENSNKNKNYFTVYLRPRKDNDIREFIDEIEEGDKSREIREIFRDGMKFRKMRNNPYENIIESNRNITETNRKEIKLEKSDVSDDDLESRLDDDF